MFRKSKPLDKDEFTLLEIIQKYLNNPQNNTEKKRFFITTDYRPFIRH